MKILVVIPHRGIGDLIYLLPLIRSLNKTFNSKINILSNKSNKANIVYKNEKCIKSISLFDLSHKNLFFNYNIKKHYLKKINSYNADLLIITSRHSSLILPMHLSNAKKKIMFDLSNIFFWNKKTKYLINCKRIYYNSKNLKLKNFVRDFKLTYKNRTFKNSIFFNLDSHHNQNNWPIDNYINVIKKISHKFKKIYINCSPKNFEIIKKITKEFKEKKFEFTFKTNFNLVIKKIQNSEIIVGNESGPICLGLSYNKKVLILYSPKHTAPESMMIEKKSKYYNTAKLSLKKLEEKLCYEILSLKK